MSNAKKHPLLIVTLLLISSLLTLAFTGDLVHAQSEIAVDVKANPGKPEIGDAVSVIVTISNGQDGEVRVESITIISPNWIKVREPTYPILIGGGESKAFVIELTVPRDASPGVNNIVVQLDTSTGTLTGTTSVDVQKLQFIPLSGDIPLSVLAIVLSGLFSYAIIIYTFSETFDRSYLELGLATVALGILNWGIYNLAANRTLDDITNSGPLDFLAVAGISIGMAAAIILIIFVLNRIRDHGKDSATLKKFRKSIARTGYAVDPRPAWVRYMTEQLDYAKSHGKGYMLRVKVYLKSDEPAINIVEGLVRIFDNEPPYGISLRPKYSIECTKAELAQSLGAQLLTKDGINTYMKADKNYRKRIQSSFPDNAVNSLQEQLIAAGTELEVTKVLEKLDFSRYSQLIVEDLKTHPKTAIFNDISYVSGENVLRVDIINYDIQYCVVLTDFGKCSIPRSYHFSETLH